MSDVFSGFEPETRGSLPSKLTHKYELITWSKQSTYS